MEVRYLGKCLSFGDHKGQGSFESRKGGYPPEGGALPPDPIPANTNKPVTVTGEKGESIDPIDFHLDYVAMRVWGDVPLDQIFSLVADELYGDPDPALFVDQEHGTKRHDRLYIGLSGVVAMTGEGMDPYEDRVRDVPCEPKPFVEFQMKSEAFTWFDETQLRDVVRRLWGELGCNVSCSRLDLAWDYCRFTVEQVRDAVEVGNVRTFAQQASYLVGRSLKGPEKGQESSTVYIGNCRQSDRSLRVYNRRGFVRSELQLRGKRAHAAWREMMHRNGGEFHARGMLLDFVNFIDRSDSANIGRCELLPWWAEFVEGVKRVRLVIPRVAKTAKQVAEWFQRKTCRSFVVMLAWLQSEGLSIEGALRTMVADGAERLNGWQKAMIAGMELPTASGLFNGVVGESVGVSAF